MNFLWPMDIVQNGGLFQTEKEKNGEVAWRRLGMYASRGSPSLPLYICSIIYITNHSIIKVPLS